MIYFANYAKAVKTAVEVLEDYEIPQAPVDLQIIFNALCREISLVTYGQFMASTGKSFDEVVQFFDSSLGACCYNYQTSQYIIFYNDSMSREVNRFTLAHELGHIFLEHHQKAGTEILNRTFISKPQYKEYENEANAFARNLLSPAPLAWIAIDEGKSRTQNYDIEMAFDISGSASNVRVNMLRRDLRDYNDEMKRKVHKLHLRYSHYCNLCKSRLPRIAKFCIVCGSTRIGKSIYFAPTPPLIPMDKYGFFVQCPCCGNKKMAEHSNYCMICGTPLKNPCLGISRDGKPHKKHINSSYAKFCEECGSRTLYNYRNIEIRMEESEMHYNDGVEYDEQTLRVKRCPVCNNDEFRDEAEFCRICGTNLYNKCEGEAEQDGYNGIYYTNQHPNPSNARFCEICGKPTYFFSEKILMDYKAYLQKAEVDALFEHDMAVAEQMEAEAQGQEEQYANLADQIDINIDIPDENDDDLPFH